MQLIDGRALAAKIRQEVKEEIQRLGITPGLGVILVGDNPASHLYVSLKEKACKEVGIKFEKYTFDGTEPESKIIETIRLLNVRSDINGILVQVPLPAPYNKEVIINTLALDKDVDGFHQVNLRAILMGEARIIPGVALGVDALIATTKIPLQNKKAVLLMNSTTFALPIEYLLEKHGALVHIILRPSEITPDIIAQLQTADILVVALGRPQIIKGDMVKDGAIVIDVGTNRLPDGKLVGDVDNETLSDKPGFITPVPGGVGPMTVAMLLKNTLELANQQTSQLQL